MPTAAHSMVSIQVNIPNLADDLLCLQLHTVWSPYTVNIPNLADDLLCLQLHTVWSPYTVNIPNLADDLLCLLLHNEGYRFLLIFVVSIYIRPHVLSTVEMK